MRFNSLLGSVDQSLVPKWIADWLGNNPFGGREILRQIQGAPSKLKKQTTPSQFEDFLEDIGNQISKITPGLLDAPIGGLNHELAPSISLSQLPLLETTLTKLKTSNVSLAEPLASFGAQPISAFVDLGLTWLEVLDLAICLDGWVSYLRIEAVVNGPIKRHPTTFDAPGIQELAKFFVEELAFLDGNRITADRLELIVNRQGWGSPKITLDEAGSRIGVTRERFRQIESQIFAMGRERRWPISDEVKSSLEPLIADGVLENFDDLRGQWTTSALVSLFELLGQSEFAEQIKTGVSDSPEVSEEAKRAVRQTRMGIGLLSLEQLRLNLGDGRSVSKLKELVSLVYPHAQFSEMWALAGDVTGTQIHTAIAIQFAMNESVSVSELVEGVKRIHAVRSEPSPLPGAEDLIELFYAAGLVNRESNRYEGEPYEFESNAKGLLYQLVKQAPGQVIHIDLLCEKLARLGVNPTTSAHYCLYEPGVRRIERGELVIPVGHKPSNEEVRAASRLAALTEHATVISFDLHDDVLVFGVEVGTSLLNRGAFSIPQRAIQYLQGTYEVSCECGEIFSSRAKVSPGGQWNLSYLTNHLAVAHNFTPGRTMNLKVFGEKLRAELV